jgi:hypothetical protein
MRVSAKQLVDSAIENFKKEFDILEGIETPISEISSISYLENISSTIEEFLRNLNDIIDDTTIRIEELTSEEDKEDEE